MCVKHRKNLKTSKKTLKHRNNNFYKITHNKNLTFVNFVVPLHVVPARALGSFANLKKKSILNFEF